MNINSDPPFILSCDWGTTTFRLSLVNYRTGEVLKTISSPQGIKLINSAGSDRPFLSYLSSQIDQLEVAISRNLRSIPVIISGMASSNIGWKELPYGELPLLLDDPNLPFKYFSATEIFPHDILLISGVCDSHDVMRGEEVQIVGLNACNDIEDDICILPGTHSKHIYIENKKIVRFKTYMTGELFALIYTKSILKDSIISSDRTIFKDNFKKGVERALESSLMGNLFSIRANHLLHTAKPEKSYDFLSGLLIGSELKELRQYSGKSVYLIGEKKLQSRYIEALEFLGIGTYSAKNTNQLTADGHRVIFNNYKKE